MPGARRTEEASRSTSSVSSLLRGDERGAKEYGLEEQTMEGRADSVGPRGHGVLHQNQGRLPARGGTCAEPLYPRRN